MAYQQNNTGNNGKPQLERLGGLWANKSKAGKKYLTGAIKINNVETKLIIFPNDRKENENQPDFNVFLKDDPQAPAQNAAPKPAYNKPAYAPRTAPRQQEPLAEDDQLI